MNIMKEHGLIVGKSYLEISASRRIYKILFIGKHQLMVENEIGDEFSYPILSFLSDFGEVKTWTDE